MYSKMYTAVKKNSTYRLFLKMYSCIWFCQWSLCYYACVLKNMPCRTYRCNFFNRWNVFEDRVATLSGFCEEKFWEISGVRFNCKNGSMHFWIWDHAAKPEITKSMTSTKSNISLRSSKCICLCICISMNIYFIILRNVNVFESNDKFILVDIICFYNTPRCKNINIKSSFSGSGVLPKSKEN